jgi:hypothetical protein
MQKKMCVQVQNTLPCGKYVLCYTGYTVYIAGRWLVVFGVLRAKKAEEKKLKNCLQHVLASKITKCELWKYYKGYRQKNDWQQLRWVLHEWWTMLQ